MRIDELRVIVSGAASGLGRSAVDFLVQHGARVAAFDIDGVGLRRLQDELGSSAADALLLYAVDVSKEEQVVAAVRQCNVDIGGLNALINNAGIYRDGRLVGASGLKLPTSQWCKVIDVDLTGTFLMTREVAGAILASSRRSGVIINMSSISRHGNVGQSPYSAAKAGVVANCRLWARELAPFGLRVAAISPGLIDTPILNATDPEVLSSYVERIPLGRLGRPDEVNAAIRFVIECDYFTGECVEVNGGFLF